MADFRIGVVPYLNACVLTDGLDERVGLTIERCRPSALADMLDRGLLDAALVPAVDFLARSDTWQVLAWYGIAVSGPAWTVKIFSDVPLNSIDRLYVDADSHSSVALADVIFAEWYKRDVSLVRAEFDADRAKSGEGWLLIGDKALVGLPRRYTYDLGELWYEHTSLPFVFAMWVSARSAADERVSELLTEAAERNLARIDELADRYGPMHGFEVSTAREYLGDIIRYRIGPREREGLELFGKLLAKHRREQVSA